MNFTALSKQSMNIRVERTKYSGEYDYFMVRRGLFDEICRIPTHPPILTDCIDEHARQNGDNKYEIYAGSNGLSYSSEHFWPQPLQYDRKHSPYTTYNLCLSLFNLSIVPILTSSFQTSNSEPNYWIVNNCELHCWSWSVGKPHGGTSSKTWPIFRRL